MKRIISSDSKYSKSMIDKMSRLEQMHQVMLSMNNEDCYFEWIYTVPDEPSREDFEYIAEDQESYDEVCKLYDDLYKSYHSDGIYRPSGTALNFARATDVRLNLPAIEVLS